MSGGPIRAAGRLAATLAAVAIRFAAAAALSVAALILLVASIGLLDEPETLSVVRADSETVRFEVASSTQATFRIAGFQAFGDGDWDGACAETAFGPSASIEPRIGVEAVYTVVSDLTGVGVLEIEFFAPDLDAETATIRGEAGVTDVSDDMLLRLSDACSAPAARRLPIWGPGEIGGAPTFRADGPSATLLSGSLEMYGRAGAAAFDPVADLAGLLGASEEPVAADREDRTLFASLASAMEIPPGSRVSTLFGEAEPALQALRGFARLEGGSLAVAVSTESPDIFFFPPGSSETPDRVRMSLFSRIGNDPTIQRATQALIFFAVALPIALELLKPFFVGRRRDD